jgi:hypothetical protein
MLDQPARETLSAIAIVLTFVGFWPYGRSILKGETKPHVFSWVIWSAVTLIVFFAQLAAKGGAGAWPTGVAGVVTTGIAILAWMRRGDTAVTRSDWLFLALAGLSLPVWFLTDDPLWAVVILTSADLLGFGPTFRKAWRSPLEESISLYSVAVVRNILIIAALETLSLTTILFPAAVAISCAIFVAMVLARRYRIAPERN